MARGTVFPLDIPATAAPSFGVPLAAADLQGKYAQLSGTFTVGAMTLQGSIDGSTYEDLASGSKSANGIFAVDEHVAFIRVSKTTNFDNTVFVNLIAFDRTEEG